MMLWKHTCDVCRKTVCDDCAPRNTDSVGSDGETTKLRVCQTCGSTGRRLGGGGSTAANETATSLEAPPQRGVEQAGGSVDPNSEAERARRVAIIEARNKSQQSRGRPQGTGGSAAPRPAPAAAPAASPPPPPQPSAPAQSTAPAVTTPPPAAVAAAAAAPATNASNRPSNPALEAAMRRQQQQQQQARGGSAAAAQAANMSPEKVKLLREIDTLLEKHREEPPFGLRASDEIKLKGYLQYLKTKYKVSE